MLQRLNERVCVKNFRAMLGTKEELNIHNVSDYCCYSKFPAPTMVGEAAQKLHH